MITLSQQDLKGVDSYLKLAFEYMKFIILFLYLKI